jgi:hypothetical protein
MHLQRKIDRMTVVRGGKALPTGAPGGATRAA